LTYKLHRDCSDLAPIGEASDLDALDGFFTHVFAVTAVIGSVPRSAAQEHLGLRLSRFKVAVFSVLSLDIG
jgi:hypothetical protein